MARHVAHSRGLIAVTLFLVAWMYAAGCEGNSASDRGEDGDAGNRAGTGDGAETGSGSGSTTTSGSGGGSSPYKDFSVPSMDATGIPCGPQGGCQVYQACCFAPPGEPIPSAFSSYFALADGGAICLANCPWGWPELTCSRSSDCETSPGAVCCAYWSQQSEVDSGSSGGSGSSSSSSSGSSSGSAMPNGTFSAGCYDNCPTGDMVHHLLCRTSSDCPSGQSCIPGPNASYCATVDGGPPDSADAGADAAMDAGSADAGFE
jgi:Cys-rich repeat protein